MKIEVYYINGRIKTYDMSSFCNSEPFRHDNLDEANCYDKDTNNVVVCVSFDVRLDKLLSNENNIEKGIDVYLKYYHISVDENVSNTQKITLEDVNGRSEYNVVHIRPGRCIPLVPEAELPEISHIDVDGKVCIKNINGKIVNIQQIDEIYSTEVSDDNNTALYEKIAKIIDNRIIKEEYRDEDRGQIAKSMGLDPEILEKAIANRKSLDFLKKEEQQKNENNEFNTIKTEIKDLVEKAKIILTGKEEADTAVNALIEATKKIEMFEQS